MFCCWNSKKSILKVARYTEVDEMRRTLNLLVNQRSLRVSTISHGVCVGEMLVLKAICDALAHLLTVQKAFISAHPPPKKFLALLRHLTQTCEWEKYTICVLN